MEDGVVSVTKSSLLSSEAVGGSSLLRNQVEAFRQRHQEALRAIDSPQPDFMPTPNSPPVKERPPDLVMPASLRHDPVIASDAFNVKSTAHVIVPDAFNVMSTAQRKLLLERPTLESDAKRQIPSKLPLLSEGPLTTTDDAASEHSETLAETSKSSLSESVIKSNNAEHDEGEELEPVRDKPDAAAASVNHERVPKALHLRFQAELHQMESIEEAERQLNQLNRLRDVATARNEAVTAATYAQVIIQS